MFKVGDYVVPRYGMQIVSIKGSEIKCAFDLPESDGTLGLRRYELTIPIASALLFGTEDQRLALLAQAIQRADELRTRHNGIGGVYLYLGHDGDNVCTLKDIDAKEVGNGCSGRSMLEAINRAVADRKEREAAKLPPDKRLGPVNEAEPVGQCAVEAACTHQVLDERGVPRTGPLGTYTLWGRIEEFAKMGGQAEPHCLPCAEDCGPAAMATALGGLQPGGYVGTVGGNGADCARGNTALDRSQVRTLIVVRALRPEQEVQDSVKKALAGETPCLVIGGHEEAFVVHI